MYRHRLRVMRDWLGRSTRKPLVLRGARQVGKSTLVRLLCAAEEADRDLLTVNLERHPQLTETFASNDPATILNVIEAVSGQSLSDRTVLFLDEIQAAPNAFASLRYFLEEMPELPIVAAGSLMEFLLSDHGFSMPVGRIEYLDLDPMTFTEFLRATGEDRLVREIESFEWPSGVPRCRHRTRSSTSACLSSCACIASSAACPRRSRSTRRPGACAPSAPCTPASWTPGGTTSRSTPPAAT